MTKTFEEWWATIPSHLKQNQDTKGDKPSLNNVNYIWVADILNKKPEKTYPTAGELLEWIISCKIDAIRK